MRTTTKSLCSLFKCFLISHFVLKTLPQCQSLHIRHDHEEYCCNNCCVYFTDLEKLKKDTKYFIKCKTCNKIFKTLKEIRKHRKKCLEKRLLRHKNKSKSTYDDESEESE